MGSARTLTRRAGARNAGTARTPVVTAVAGVERLLAPEVAALLWQRTGGLQPCLQRAARAVGHVALRTVVGVDAEGRIGPRPFLAGLPTVLARDIAFLVELGAVLAGARAVGVRLASLDRRMCPRFHVDRVTLRATCAYLGDGTEWLEAGDVDPRWLGRPLPGGLAAGDPVARPGATVRRAATGDVLFMKGELGVAPGLLPTVHRSPAGPAGAVQRLVLTLDPLA
jgi:hypothetical protein